MEGLLFLVTIIAMHNGCTGTDFVDMKADNKSLYAHINKPLNVSCNVTINSSFKLFIVSILKNNDLITFASIIVKNGSCNTGSFIVYCDHENLEYTFEFNSSQYAIGDQLRCRAQIGESSSSASSITQNYYCTVYSIVEIRKIDIIENATIDLGESRMYSCVSSPPCRPKATLQWQWTSGDGISSGIQSPVYKYNSTLSTTVQHLNYTAKIDDIGKGLYCEGKQLTVRKNSTVLNLNIRYPPTLSPLLYRNESGPILDGNTVNFTCKISGGNPLATFTWYCKGMKMDPTHTTIENTSISTLILKVDKTFHAKSCNCTAWHPVNGYREEKSTNITVIYESDESVVLEQVPEGPIYEGRGVSLECKLAGGYPLPILTWSCAGDVMNKTAQNESISTLTFNVTAMDNNKLCTCVATHSVITTFERKATHILVVYYTPTDLPAIEQYPDGPVDKGTVVVLQCTVAGGNPIAVLMWNCSGDMHYGHNRTSGNMANYSIEITVTPNDNGRICICSAHHYIDTYRANMNHTLHVYYEPQNAMMTAKQQPWFAGKTYNVSCIYTPGNPESYIYWKLDEEILQDEDGHIIYLKAEKKLNGRSLTCEVYNIYTTQHNITVSAKDTRLNIEYVPVIKVTTEHIVKTEGDNITTVCIANGNPVPNVIWIYNKTTQSETTGNKAELNLPYISRFQSGEYICQATSISAAHGNLKSSKATVIDVQYAPDVRVFTNESTITENGTLILSCEAEGNPPSYTYQGWRHTYNGMLIRDNGSLSVYIDGNKLILNSLKYHDTGEYSCYAQNGVKNKYGLTQNGSREIEIKVSPLLLSLLPQGNTFAVKKNGNLSIEMDFVAVPNVTSIDWYNSSANSILQNNDEVKTKLVMTPIYTILYNANVTVTKNSFRATLDMNNFQDYKEGWYSLLVTNNFTTANFSVRAVLSDVPDPPQNLKVNQITETIICFMWTRGENGGHHQTFHFLYYENQPDAELKKKTIDDTYKDQQLLSIAGLNPGTFYNFTVFASNTIGNSTMLSYYASTSTSPVLERPKNQVGLIVGGSCSAVLLGLIVVITFIVRRRYFQRGKGKEEIGRRQLTDGEGNDEEEDGLKDNILYGLMDNASYQAGNRDQYAMVQKQNSKFDLPDDPQMQETPLYAEVKKIDKKRNKGRENYIIDTKTNSGLKKGKGKSGDVYENMETHQKENVITEGKKNKDGLQYADLVFSPSSSGPKFIIHGIEDRTVYAEVDTSQKIDPLPDSDEEETEDTEDPIWRG